MRHFILVTLIISPSLLSGCQSDAITEPGVADFSYDFTRLDVPGALQTLPSGINKDGRVVGWYTQGGVTSGFIYGDGKYTTVVYPVAAFTQLRGIGPDGDMVGTYRLAGEPSVNIYGFTLTKSGEFIRTAYPGHTSTIAQRILPNGTILGCYHDMDTMGSMHGMTIRGAATSEIGTFASMQNGGTPDGRKVVGFFTDMAANKGRAFLIENGVFNAFDAPASTATDAWDISPTGTIVGSFQDAATSRLHGYVLIRGEFKTIDFPGSISTDVFGINERGDIVGKYREVAGGPLRGYVAVRIPRT